MLSMIVEKSDTMDVPWLEEELALNSFELLYDMFKEEGPSARERTTLPSGEKAIEVISFK